MRKDGLAVGDLSLLRSVVPSRISILIVTWNGDGLLRDCLASLASVYGESLEIVVVDNAALESTRLIVSSHRNAKYVAAKENLGFAGGNNLGLPFCSGDYILLLNNDTIVRADSLTPLMDFLTNNPRVGIVQGTMNVPALNNGLDDCGTLVMPWGLQRHLHRGEPTETTPLVPRQVTAAKGAMMMIRRKVIDDVGFLFYDHFKSYFEETDFCRRAANHGWETWFIPTIPVDHLCGATSSRLKRDEVWVQYFRNIIFSFSRNWGISGKFLKLPLFCCAAFVRSPLCLLKAMGRLVCGDATLQ